MPTELLLLPSPVPSKCENKLSELLGCLLPLLFLFCPKRRAKLPLHASSSSTLEVTFASLDPHTCTIDCCCCLSKTQTHLHLDHLSSRRSEKNCSFNVSQSVFQCQFGCTMSLPAAEMAAEASEAAANEVDFSRLTWPMSKCLLFSSRHPLPLVGHLITCQKAHTGYCFNNSQNNGNLFVITRYLNVKTISCEVHRSTTSTTTTSICPSLSAVCLSLW